MNSGNPGYASGRGFSLRGRQCMIPISGNVGCAMSKNTSVSLGNHFSSFVEAQVQTGRYGSASDVLRAGLRLLEEHEAKVEALRQALKEGEESGVGREIDFEDFKAKMRAKS